MNKLEKLLELLLKGENISIEYSNIDGEESLVINGVSDIQRKITKYEDNLKRLDDCDFLEIAEKAASIVDVNKFDELISKNPLTKDEEIVVESMINSVNLIIHEHLTNKIEELQDILNNL